MKFPLSNVIFETAKACNLSCKYCYNHWRQPGSTFDDASDKVRWKTLKRIIKKIDFQRITFTGGEPFLIKDLEEHILYCRMKKKAVNVISNGNCGTDERYTVLDELGVSIMQFPLLADNSEVHDSLTNQIGSFDKVLNSIKFFRDRKANVCTVFVMTKKNISYIEQTIKYAEKLGVNNFMLARFNIGGMGIHNVDELLISSKLLNNAFQLAEDMAPKLNIKLSANVCVPHCVVNPLILKISISHHAVVILGGVLLQLMPLEMFASAIILQRLLGIFIKIKLKI